MKQLRQHLTHVEVQTSVTRTHTAIVRGENFYLLDYENNLIYKVNGSVFASFELIKIKKGENLIEKSCEIENHYYSGSLTVIGTNFYINYKMPPNNYCKHPELIIQKRSFDSFVHVQG